jgi:uncharacterized protein YjbI with pentapeptide repeats
LQKADLEGANLEGANLQNADLSRANLEGASLEGANLKGARLNAAQLELANLGGANLENAHLTGADLSETYLGGAKLMKADLQRARLEKANLEEADLSGANLREANLREAYLQSTNFSRTFLEGTIFDKATLASAIFADADLRRSFMREAKLSGVVMTGAKLFGVEVLPEQLSGVKAEWVDFSAEANQKTHINGEGLVEQFRRTLNGAAPAVSANLAAPAHDQTKRFFGKGDVLRNATLEFGDKSVVEIESRFEKCAITLGRDAQLTIGPNGVLDSCQINGSGEIVVLGEFTENGGAPGLKGIKRLIVGKNGFVSGTLQQPAEMTQFGFEKGCVLRLKIVKSK